MRNSSHGKRLLLPLVFFSGLFLTTFLAVQTTLAAQQPTLRDFDVTASQFAFEPSTIRVNLGDNVTIRLSSSDVSHGLYIDGYDVDARLIMHEAEEGQYVNEAVINFVADKPGTFRFRCSITCGYLHPFMIGKLIVEPSYQFPISAALAGIVSAGSTAYLWRNSTGTPKPIKKIDLFQISILKRIVKQPYFQFWLMFPSLVIFVIVILSGVFGSPVGNKNMSVMFVWILWWVALMLFLVPFAGRGWCSMCPLPSFGEWLQRRAITEKKEKLFGLKLKWPARLDNIWIQNFAFLSLSIFLGILMTRPWATGYLMILLILLPLIFGLVFVGRAYCKYVCPVSGFIGLYSNYSTLELRAKDKEKCMEHLHQFQTACQSACPAGIKVQDYVGYVAQGKYRDAVSVIREQMPLVGVCGRVCTHPCETECERGKVDQPIAIRELKRFVADYEIKNGREKASPIAKTKQDKVAIIGSGPAGLACAYDLVRKGYPVTVFEAAPEAGGLMRYGIPEFRLPRETIDYEIDYLRDLGVEIKTNTPVDGKKLTLDKLKDQGYRAFFLATGTQLSRRLKVEGVEAEGIEWGLDFLKAVSSGRKVKFGDKVLVVGGGNVAIDVALTARRLGAKQVEVACLEARKEMPAFLWEVQDAIDEGIEIDNSYGVKKVLHDGKRVEAVELTRCVSVFDRDGKFNPAFDDSETRIVKADTVIFAIGQAPDLSFLPDEIKIDKNAIAVYPLTLETNLAGVFAGGDVVGGPANVIDAISAGKEAAISIDRYLQGVDLKEDRHPILEKVTDVPKQGLLKKHRAETLRLEPDKRAHSFAEIELGFDEKTATEEALRCLRCGSWMMDCMKGNENGYGCPWFESPQYLSRNAYCGLCMECVKTCPNDNVALNLRKGGEDLFVEPKQGFKKRGLDEAWKAFIMSTLAFLYGLVWMGNYAWLKNMASLSNLGQWVLYAFGIVWSTTLVLTPAVFFVFVVFSKLLSGSKDVSIKRLFINYSYMLIPISLLAWVAFSVSILFISGSYLISVISDPFGWGWNLFGTKYYPWTPFFSGLVPYIQIAALLSGLVLSIRAVNEISRRTFPDKSQALKGSIPMVAMLVGYTILLLWLWVG